jgi:hypothetical protein
MLKLPAPKRAGLIFAALIASTPAFAQWIGYPTADVPRKADGAVDMSAPAPRTADGRPDLAGLWIADNTPEGEETPSDVYQLSSGHHMRDMGVDIEGGLPYQDWLLPIVEKTREDLAIDDPHIRCLPDNFLRAYGLPHLQKFIQTPDLLIVLNEMNAGYRQVFLDGRALPDDPSPSWQGYSSGRWSDDTLIVDTIGIRNNTWIDWSGSVLTEQAKVREEFTRFDYGHLEIKVFVDDPGAYTRPWNATLRMRMVVDAELIDEICLENEQFVERMGLPY